MGNFEDETHNTALLEEIERRGGGYVWEQEVFAVQCIDKPLDTAMVDLISGLRGVREVYVDASEIGFAGTILLAKIAGLAHLGIARWTPSATEWNLISTHCGGARLIPDSEL